VLAHISSEVGHNIKSREVKEDNGADEGEVGKSRVWRGRPAFALKPR
jgi:hypothetical protein